MSLSHISYAAFLLKLLLDLGGLAHAVAQIVQLGAAHAALADNLHGLHVGGVQVSPMENWGTSALRES